MLGTVLKGRCFMANIYIIDDDFAVEPLADSLSFLGHEVCRINSATKAFQELDALAAADLVIIDIMMECPEGVSVRSAQGGLRTGYLLVGELRKKNAKVPIIVYSGTQDASLIKELRSTRTIRFVSKHAQPTRRDMLQIISEVCGSAPANTLPTAFIVHGHDEEAKLALKN